MPTLHAVDSAEVHILVDNITDSLSSVPDFVETEFAGLRRRRQDQWVLGGACLCGAIRIVHFLDDGNRATVRSSSRARARHRPVRNGGRRDRDADADPSAD